jgi:hypothetical protein
MEFGLVIGFLEILQLVTTSKDYALTVLHQTQITIRHTRSSRSVTVFTNRCLVTAFNGGRSPSSGFPNCPRASATSFSQQHFKTAETQQSYNLLIAAPNLFC